MKMLKRVMLVILFLSVIPLVMAAGNDVQDHPGFVDFSDLALIANTEPTVEISLKAPLLNMITNLIRNEDDEAADFISKLLRVTVNVFESSALDIGEVAGSMEAIADDLDYQGWERVVRVREDDDHVDVYFRLSDDAEIIHGIAIMIAAPGETVLVNIVGDISMDDISALGRRFDIDELVDLDVN
ncbi:MAG: DUF4252 domain-containing protein [Pseudohongiella sp.]|nr:DUF4252 domain-containing protein [Pseudohongiella sp.]